MEPRLAGAINGSSDGAHQASGNLGFGLRSDNPVDFAAGLQDQQRWNTLDPEAVRRERVVIDVHSCELNPSCHFRGKLIENRSNRPAGAAPGRPHIQDDGKRCVLDLRGKVGVGDVYGMAGRGDWKREFAAAANGLESSA